MDLVSDIQEVNQLCNW